MLIALLAINIVVLLVVLFSMLKIVGTKNNHLAKDMQRIEQGVKDEISLNRRELGESIKLFENSIIDRITSLTESNEKKAEQVRQTVEQKLHFLQEDNNKKLELMRETVDEKLHATLEKRLGESFKSVVEMLEQVHKGLGEMQSLKTGVDGLNKVFSNVKSRGTWGEFQLEALLEQILTSEQYEKNVATKKGSSERVEFAVKLPGRGENKEEIVYLPIDAKFPKEDYERLVDAQEALDTELINEMTKAIEVRIKAEAKDIHQKYIDPPNTTDFGILFIPIESLYAEVVRRPGLCDVLQRQYRVVVTGPTTLSALLNSLQMGFRTLAIEKRSSEVWKLLGAVKTQFRKFGDLLDKTHKKLGEASRTIEDASRKSRYIEGRLSKVQELPSEESNTLLSNSLETDL